MTVVLNISAFYLCFKDRNRTTGACTDMQTKIEEMWDNRNQINFQKVGKQ